MALDIKTPLLQNAVGSMFHRLPLFGLAYHTNLIVLTRFVYYSQIFTASYHQRFDRGLPMPRVCCRCTTQQINDLISISRNPPIACQPVAALFQTGQRKRKNKNKCRLLLFVVLDYGNNKSNYITLTGGSAYCVNHFSF